MSPSDRPARRPAREQLVGVLRRRGRFQTVEPLFHRGRAVTVEKSREVADGDLVVVSAHGRGRGQLARRIGRPDVARDVIEALMVDRGLRRSFDAAVERESRGRAGGSGRLPQPPARRDLRALATFTIDPADARDFDDAISAEQRGAGAWRIWVHIADVAAHVRPDSLLDREAERRGTSVYVPGAVEPMLPEALSNSACSLVPGEERLAVTVELDLRGAEVQRAAFYRSLIRSDERLDYDRVDRIFAGAERAGGSWAGTLAAARAAAAALSAARAASGALVVDSPEPEWRFDRDGHVWRAGASVQTESHRLIEHLMIAANEQVATLLSERRIPMLYRVHEQPDAARIEHLVSQLASLDVPTPPLPERLSRQQAGELVAALSRSIDEHVRRVGHGRAALTSLLLRSLQQALYSPLNVGHAGLRSARYCHFSSPIRRYPDLVCHRALLAAVGGGEESPRAAGLAERGAWASARERDALEIERAADRVAACFVLARELAEGGPEQDFDGEIVGLIPAGAFVAFGDGHEGFLPLRKLGGDWWELDALGTALHGAESGGVLRLGDPVCVEVERVDMAGGRVDLLPVRAG